MLKMAHIHLAFTETLIEDGTLEVPHGCLTVIKGASGKGKSSLLYLAGLLMDEPGLAYTFDGHPVSHQDRERALFRQQYIGYVFQDNSLITHLSLYENLKLYADMVGGKFTQEDAMHILHKFHIERNPQSRIDTLSGGEKQRLAIACAMVKRPRLLILDEPTSALDRKNSALLLEILKGLSQKGMMILIASHDSHVFEAGDVIYEIENRQLVNTTQNASIKACDDVPDGQKHPLKPAFYFQYYLTYFKKNWHLQVLMLMLCGLTMAVFVSLTDIGETFLARQQESLDLIANREILIASQDLEGMGYYADDLPTLTNDELARVEALEHVQSVYPFFESLCLEVKVNGEDKIHRETLPDESEVVTSTLVIQPYAADRNINNECQMTDGTKDQLYITGQAGDVLGISRLDGQRLSLRCILPGGEPFSLQDQEISGIVSNSIRNQYTPSTAIIYVPVTWFGYIEPQALLIYADHFQNIKTLGQKLEQINPEWAVFTHYLRDESMIGMQHAFESVMPFIRTVLLVLNIVLISLLYGRYITQRKKEICLLKVNGLSRLNTIQMITIELFLQTLFILVASLMGLIIIDLGIGTLLGYPLQVDYMMKIMLIAPMIFIMMLIPSLVALLVFQRIDVALVLRESSG